jgi:hypothetical protein
MGYNVTILKMEVLQVVDLTHNTKYLGVTYGKTREYEQVLRRARAKVREKIKEDLEHYPCADVLNLWRSEELALSYAIMCVKGIRDAVDQDLLSVDEQEAFLEVNYL